MKRWIPRKGEVVKLVGGAPTLPKWEGKVLSVTRRDCEKDHVYLNIEGYGYTTAERAEIVIQEPTV